MKDKRVKRCTCDRCSKGRQVQGLKARMSADEMLREHYLYDLENENRDK